MVKSTHVVRVVVVFGLRLVIYEGVVTEVKFRMRFWCDLCIYVCVFVFVFAGVVEGNL